MTHPLLFAGAVSGFFAVALGAFGAHGLKNKLPADLLAVYQTGVEYHFYHSLALLAVGILVYLLPANNALRWSGWCFAAGILVFSGSLYILSLTGVRWLGAITPIGGVAFLVGWATLAYAVTQVK